VRDPRWQGENFAKNRAALTQLETLAADKGIALSQLALAWLLAQGDDVVPIPGTRNARRLEENVGAAGVTLSEQQSVRESPRDRSEGSKDLFRTDLG
jgi:aryl-alcohol dehydrogenase-like predicted oxidoreductase